MKEEYYYSATGVVVAAPDIPAETEVCLFVFPSQAKFLLKNGEIKKTHISAMFAKNDIVTIKCDDTVYALRLRANFKDFDFNEDEINNA